MTQKEERSGRCRLGCINFCAASPPGQLHACCSASPALLSRAGILYNDYMSMDSWVILIAGLKPSNVFRDEWPGNLWRFHLASSMIPLLCDCQALLQLPSNSCTNNSIAESSRLPACAADQGWFFRSLRFSLQPIGQIRLLLQVQGSSQAGQSRAAGFSAVHFLTTTFYAEIQAALTVLWQLLRCAWSRCGSAAKHSNKFSRPASPSAQLQLNARARMNGFNASSTEK